jgi:hypothetical protein
MTINKPIAFSIIGALLFGASSMVSAEELVVTAGAAKKGGSTIALDLVTEGSTVAFQFNIPLPKGIEASQVDLSRCVADLPKTHSGQCNVAKGQIIGLVYNDQNVALPKGIVSVGQIGLKGNIARGGITVSNFVANDASARELPAKTNVSFDK